MKILAMIPARAGSKGLPGKNVKQLLGKPLIQHAFETARESGVLDRIILSTDCMVAADLAKAIGLEVPFLRPAELATDVTAMIDVAMHALTTLAAANYTPDALLLLQPTSPLRLAEHIRQAVALLEGVDAVCSVTPLPRDLCPHYLMKLGPDGYLDFFAPEGTGLARRQDVPQAYKRDGTIYLARSDVILGQRSFYGKRTRPLMINWGESVSIDGPEDWRRAEQLLRARLAA